MIARTFCLKPTALFVSREIAKLRRGRQSALVSFSDVAMLAGKPAKGL